MMFVSIVGHASFHTALWSGPSMIERSYLRRSTLAGAAGAVSAAGGAGGGETAPGWVTRAIYFCAAKTSLHKENRETRSTPSTRSTLKTISMPFSVLRVFRVLRVMG